MKNERRVKIFERFKDDIAYYSFLDLTPAERKEMLSKFSYYHNYDSLDEEEILAFHDASTASDEHIFAITDDGIYVYSQGSAQKIDWEYINSVKFDGQKIIFDQTEFLMDSKFPPIWVCSPSMLDAREDFEKFITTLNKLAQVGKQDEGDDDDDEEDISDEDTFDVTLKSVGRQKLEIVKTINKSLGVRLATAKELVDDAPSVIAEELPRRQAEEIKEELEDLGATVQLKLVSKSAPKPKTKAKSKRVKDDNRDELIEQLQRQNEEAKASASSNSKPSKPQKTRKEVTTSSSSPFDITVNDKNVGEIFSEGKSGRLGGVDLSVCGRLKDKEAERYSNDLKLRSSRPSEYGSEKDIRNLVAKIQADLQATRKAILAVNECKKQWAQDAYPLFVKACRANRRIVFGSNGFNIVQGGNDEKSRPGVYTVSVPVPGRHNVNDLPDDIASDLMSLAEALQPVWQRYLKANEEAWKAADVLSSYNPVAKGKTLEDIATNAQKFISKSSDEINKTKTHDALRSELNRLELETNALKKEFDVAIGQLSQIDPVLAAFELPADKHVYDSAWLETVKAAAEARKSMPYLPLTWHRSEFGSVFNWKKAVEDGKPNLFIEATTDEGSDGRMDMLDNFLATILLAFPAKQVHITVLENRTINDFATKLPDKICQIYDASADGEAIRMFTRKLKEMYRAARDNQSEDCSPREIVVIAGFEKRDTKFSRLIDDLHEIIENGRRAGIYFAMVLAKDITEYDWADEDANDFEQFFTPYSTILTDKKDKLGNPLPDYNLLRRDADVPTDDGYKPGSLGELIKAYLEQGTSTVPNKVYEGIENGELYKAKPIKALDDQPKKDAGKLVIPIAQTDNGEELSLRLDDESYISCFILGRSGMGKSFTLHTILTNLMLKYDPSTTEVILMDFKPGGVEMNYYKDVPHVSSLLVNGADKQVAGEILASIIKEMERRGELFQKYDVSSIGRYNSYAAKNDLDQMKHIVMLVDECQDLFKVENPNSDTNIVTDIARKGRSYGIHMILATQTLQKTDIPGDALAQFSDFLFMGCKEDDVMKCEINNRDVQKQVGQLVKGEVIYCHRGAEPVHGYVYNYYGKGGEYREKTRESLLSNRFSRPDKKQFYFNASQSYLLDKDELRALTDAAKSGLKPVPMAALGKNLSVKADTLYSKFGASDGANLLVLGANDSLQGERVLWNAALAVYDCNKALGNDARYFVLPNIPEDVESNALKYHKARMEMLKVFANRPGVTLVDEAERAEIIERVAATVRGRQHLAESDRKAVKGLDSIYLIIPNQQLFYTKMSRSPKGLESLDNYVVVTVQAPAHPSSAKDTQAADALGFEGLVMPGDEQSQESSAPDFMSIDFGSFDSPSGTSSSPMSVGKPGRNIDEELRYILEYGPTVNVHVLIQSIAPDKIYSQDAMREKEMNLLFNDIVFLKMLQAGSMSLPVDSRVIEQLSADPKSLRAIAYNGSRGVRTIVPFEIPVINK